MSTNEQRAIICAIDGVNGSGKSTFCSNLKRELE